MQIAQLFLANSGILLELLLVTLRVWLLIHSLSGLRPSRLLRFRGLCASSVFLVRSEHFHPLSDVLNGLLTENALDSAPLNAVVVDFFDHADALEHSRDLCDAPLPNI